MHSFPSCRYFRQRSEHCLETGIPCSHGTPSAHITLHPAPHATDGRKVSSFCTTTLLIWFDMALYSSIGDEMSKTNSFYTFFGGRIFNNSSYLFYRDLTENSSPKHIIYTIYLLHCNNFGYIYKCQLFAYEHYISQLITLFQIRQGSGCSCFGI